MEASNIRVSDSSNIITIDSEDYNIEHVFVFKNKSVEYKYMLFLDENGAKNYLTEISMFKGDNICKLLEIVQYLILYEIPFKFCVNLYENKIYLSTIIKNIMTLKITNSVSSSVVLVDSASNLFDNYAVLGEGGYSNVYDYDGNALKVSTFRNGIIEFLNYIKLKYTINSLKKKHNCLNLNIANFKNIFYYINKSGRHNAKNINNNKFILAIEMEKYQPLSKVKPNINVSNLLSFVIIINFLNSNSIGFFDLKHDNVLWKDDYIMIDFGAIQFKKINKYKTISSHYNSQLSTHFNNINDIDNEYDVYGALDVVLWHYDINWCKTIFDFCQYIEETKQFSEEINNFPNIVLLSKHYRLSHFRYLFRTNNKIDNYIKLFIKQNTDDEKIMQILYHGLKGDLSYNHIYKFLKE